MKNIKGGNAKLIKIHNWALILKIILQRGPISRIDISKLTHLTQAAVTKITEKLLEGELIVEVGKKEGSKNQGRKPILLKINSKKYNVISVYVSRYMTKAALFDLSGKMIYMIVKNMGINNSNNTIGDNVIDVIDRLLSTYHIDLRNVLGIGLSAPGPINTKNGILRTVKKNKLANNLKRISGVEIPFNWDETPLKDIIQDHYGISVFADNCANVSALAESWFGNGVGIDNFVFNWSWYRSGSDNWWNAL